MSGIQPPSPVWGAEDHQLVTVARNMTTRYLAIGADAIIGFMLLPFNVHHLGQSAYGLWMLTASVTTYFSVLDLGYNSALVKFVAQYRAWRDSDALNEVLSSMFSVFAGIGVLSYLVISVVAFTLQHFLNLTSEQAYVGRQVMLITGVYVAVSFAFSVYGSVINGFQRYYMNNVVSVTSSVAVAVTNVALLKAGYGLVGLVAGTTAVRLLGFALYRWNAYRVFPGMRISVRRFKMARLREVSGFSLYALVINWAHKLNFEIDAVIVGAFITPAAVAVWAVADRIPQVTLRLTNQFNSILFPMVVDSAASSRLDRLRLLFVQGTRVSLATCVPLAGGLAVLASGLVSAWVGRRFAASVPVVQILMLVVMFRVGTATGTTLLKGAGQHRLLTVCNVIMGLINVALSIALVKPLGLVGVALGTLLPVSLISMFVIFPAACRRVEISTADGFRRAVWPAVWPIIPVIALLFFTKSWIGPRLLPIAFQLLGAAALYLGIFVLFALGGRDRNLYLTKAAELLRRRPGLQAVA